MARGGAGAEEASLRSNALSWLACGLLALLANAWIILSISAKQQKHKPLELLLCFLAGTHILMAAVPLTTPGITEAQLLKIQDYLPSYQRETEAGAGEERMKVYGWESAPS